MSFDYYVSSMKEHYSKFPAPGKLSLLYAQFAMNAFAKCGVSECGAIGCLVRNDIAVIGFSSSLIEHFFQNRSKILNSLKKARSGADKTTVGFYVQTKNNFKNQKYKACAEKYLFSYQNESDLREMCVLWYSGDGRGVPEGYKTVEGADGAPPYMLPCPNCESYIGDMIGHAKTKSESTFNLSETMSDFPPLGFNNDNSVKKK